MTSVIHPLTSGLNPGSPVPTINQNEPKPIVLKDRIIKDWYCPHCGDPIQEKSLYCDWVDDQPDLTKERHQCGGLVTRPFRTPEEELAHQTIMQQFGITESYYPYYYVIDGAPVLINESLAKSVRERIHRRTRAPGGGDGTINPEPVIKKDGDNDPRKTSRGRASLRGSRKKARDKRKSKRLTETVEFINAVDRELPVIMEAARKLSDPIFTLRVIDRALALKESNDSQFLETLGATLRHILEQNGYISQPRIAKLGDDSESEILAECVQEVDNIRTLFDNVWIERVPIEKNLIVRFTVIGESVASQRYVDAIDNGYVHQGEQR